jgi:hypothetical protein
LREVADNLNGARVVGRIIKVDHVGDYKRKLEEDEEEKQRKREERGVCYAFQRGECNRGADCKFSHDEEVRFLLPCVFRCCSFTLLIPAVLRYMNL